MMDKIDKIEARRSHLLEGGTRKAVEKQHEMRKLTARERIDRLLDQKTFQEFDLWVKPIKTGFDIDDRELPGDAVITGIGKIHNRPVCVYAHDFTVAGGTFGSTLHYKVTRAMEIALEKRIPLIQMIDSGGERIQDRFGKPAYRPVLGGRLAIAGSSCMYHAPMICSGVIPQITLMLGPMYAGSAYVPTMADFMIMRDKTAFMSVASPALLKSVTYADVTQEEIGGAKLHASVAGTVDFIVETDEQAIEICRELMTYLPLHNKQSAPIVDTGDDPDRCEENLLTIKPAGNNQTYDMHEVIRCIVDKGDFLELQQLFAKSMIIGFARLNQQTVGIVANNPTQDNGILTLDTCDKQARFIRWCDAFNVPVIFLVDTPGFSADIADEQSRNGLVRTAAKPVFAICEATVPMITVYIGRCFGTSRLIMGNLNMGVDCAYCWPSAWVARVKPEEALESIYRKEFQSSAESKTLREEKFAEFINKYFNFPYHALEQGMANDVIDPRDTRPYLVQTLERLADKDPTPRPWRKHSLIPQ